MQGPPPSGGPQPPMPPQQWEAYCHAQRFMIQQIAARRKAIVKAQVDGCVSLTSDIRQNKHKDIVRPGGRQSYFQVYFQDHKGDTPPITEQMKNAQLKTRRVIEALEDSGWSTVEDKALQEIMETIVKETRERLVEGGKLDRRLLDPNFLPPPEPKPGRGRRQQQQESQAAEDDRAARRRAERRARMLISAHIDWNDVADQFNGKAKRVKSERRRTRPEIRQRWENKLWTVDEWTKGEAKRLVDLATHKYKERDWVGVAKELDTGHTPLQCMRFYERTCKIDNINTQEWHADEDQRLLEGMHMHSSNWLLVAEHVESRTHLQCRQRYDTLMASQQQRPWTREEDMRLAMATRAFVDPKDVPLEQVRRRRKGAFSWQEVAKYMDSRVDTHCRARWEVLDPKVNRGKFKEDEYKRLRELVAQYGDSDWVLIAKMLGNGRSRAQVRNAYLTSLSKDERKKYKMSVKKKRDFSVVRGKRTEGQLSAQDLRSILESKGVRKRRDGSGSEDEEEEGGEEDDEEKEGDEEEEAESGSDTDEEEERQYEGSSDEESSEPEQTSSEEADDDDDDEEEEPTLSSVSKKKAPRVKRQPKPKKKAPAPAKPPRAPARATAPPARAPPPPASEGSKIVAFRRSRVGRTSKAPSRYGQQEGDEQQHGSGGRRRQARVEEDEDEEDDSDDDGFIYGYRPTRGSSSRGSSKAGPSGGKGAAGGGGKARAGKSGQAARGASAQSSSSRKRARGEEEDDDEVVVVEGSDEEEQQDEEEEEWDEDEQQAGGGKAGGAASQGPPKKRHKQREQQEEEEQEGDREAGDGGSEPMQEGEE